MEFPFGHHHHHGRRDEEEEQRYRPPPCNDRPGGEGYGNPAYPPPPTHHVSHEVGYGYEPPRPYPGAGYGEGGYSGHHNRPPCSSGVHHVGHESWGGGGSPAPPQLTVRIFTKAEENYALSIRDGNVILAPANPRDEYQHWIKDMRYANNVKDEEGFPSFALVNKVTGQAIKHSIGATHPVRLIRYNPDYVDESVLWTESADTGGDFRCIRMVNNIRLNFDAFHGDEDHGGVRDGTTVVLWEWLKGKNQRWKILPYSGHHNRPPYSSGVHHVGHESWGGGARGPRTPPQPTVRIFTKAEENYSLSIRDGSVMLAPANPRDEYQHWIKDMRYAHNVKDEQGFPSFALVNKVTGQAIKHSIGATHPVRLIRYNPDYVDESVLWTESADTGEGFRCIRMVNNIRLNFDAFHGDKDHGGVRDGTTVVLWEWLKGKNQRWKILPY
ncbi:Ricin B-like lectin R40G2 [Cocos nucifera]|uniref:Ricin B-like lectin R40G2 n=1 Tax=Cocos nucifera TaxID=13894 RepID=A0A8K0I6H3_COCNU|nr:Ricin B-like lectin R40G2 [Cocos nucifera]